VAAKLIQYFCIDDDGTFNRRLVAIKLAIAFLDRVGTAPAGTGRGVALKDLQDILVSGANLQQLEDWARAHYGL
jgi:hypothetical protein